MILDLVFYNIHKIIQTRAGQSLLWGCLSSNCVKGTEDVSFNGNVASCVASKANILSLLLPGALMSTVRM